MVLPWKHLKGFTQRDSKTMAPYITMLFLESWTHFSSMRAIFIFARMCVKTSTDVILQSFRFEQSPWQCEGKQRYILPNTCLAPTVKGDKDKRWARNMNQKSKSPRISGRWTVTGNLLLSVRAGLCCTSCNLPSRQAEGPGWQGSGPPCGHRVTGIT